MDPAQIATYQQLEALWREYHPHGEPIPDNCRELVMWVITTSSEWRKTKYIFLQDAVTGRQELVSVSVLFEKLPELINQLELVPMSHPLVRETQPVNYASPVTYLRATYPVHAPTNLRVSWSDLVQQRRTGGE